MTDHLIRRTMAGRSPVINKTISHYRIVEPIGKGGMGMVYRAFDTKLQRTVALKVLPPQFASDEKRKRRLISEAQAASSLNHPNICTIHEIDEVDGVLFIAMEYLGTRTLLDHIREAPIAHEKVLEIAIQVANALDKTHSRNLIHRDIKPSNIALTEEDNVKILDFGLARILRKPDQETPSDLPTGDARELSESGIVGTVSYMSPEQIRHKELDGRSDMFSFAMVLYELLTGRSAFSGETSFEIVSSILKDEPEPINKINPHVPSRFAAIVHRALQKERDQRYPSMHEMLHDLKKLAGHSSTKSGIDRFHPELFTWNRRSLILVSLFVILLTYAFLKQTSIFPPGLSIPQKKHLAVIPFLNVGGEPAGQAFCDGFVETLTSKLTQLEDFNVSLSVIPSSEVRKYRTNSAQDARKIFNVNLALTGSLQRSTSEVRLTVNLVDAVTLRQIQSKTVNYKLGDVFLLQDGMVKQVTEMMDLYLNPETAGKLLKEGVTQNPAAYDFYLQGRGHLQRYENMENVDNAIALFQQSLALDPVYALAYSGLGEAYWRKFDLNKDPNLVEQARSNCIRAVAINDRLAQVHLTLGVVLSGTGRYEEAIKELEKAIQLHPSNSDAYRELAGAYEGMGRTDKAEATYKKAIEIWPDYWAGYNRLGVFYYLQGKYRDAEKMFLRVIELTPDNVRGYFNLGGMYSLMGEYEKAVKMLEKSISIQPTADAYTNLGTLYYFLGRYSQAVPLMEKAAELAPNEYLMWGNLGDTYRWAPELRQKASAAYKKAIELAEKALIVNPKDPQLRARLAVYWSKQGEHLKALEEIEHAEKLAPQNTNVLFKSVLVYELAGKRETALKKLKMALKGGYSPEEVQNEPELQNLRKDLRFQNLITKTN